MKKLKLILFFLFLTGLFSCYEPIPGSGIIVEKEFTSLPVFNSIIFEGVGKVIVTSGSPRYVKIRTDDNFIELDSIKVEDNKLIIKTPNNIGPTILEIYVTIEDLSEIGNYGSGTIEVQNNFTQGATFWLSNSSSGIVNINQFDANSCNVSNSGSGGIIIETASINNDITLDNSGSGRIIIKNISSGIVKNAINDGSGLLKIYTGNSDNSNLSNSGSGTLDFLGLVSINASAKNSGSGKIKLSVTTNLDADITGSGDIEYMGNPVVNLTKTGNGKLIKLN